MTFSSDLVFDGQSDRPYVEEDAPRPLSVYGAAKAEAERRVLDLLPASLVVRTSAFFGPWDDSNFLTSLFRALDEGVLFWAPTDNTVSPTYVPDLVHASLDLLMDRESGLWHLANDGAVTWFEFACAAAERSGRAVDLIQPVDSVRVWSPAPRPRYSALSSSRGHLLRPLTDALEAYVRDVQTAGLAGGTKVCASPQR